MVKNALQTQELNSEKTTHSQLVQRFTVTDTDKKHTQIAALQPNKIINQHQTEFRHLSGI